MIFRRSFFLCLIVMGIFLPFIADAGKVCGIGKWLYTTKCYDCPAGCYCTGGNEKTYALDPADVMGNDEVTKYCKSELSICTKPKVSNKYYAAYGDCGVQNDAKIYKCPSEFPNSKPGVTSANDCYKTCTAGHTGGKGPIIHNKKIHCDAGYYLPYEKETCSKCLPNYICPTSINVYPDCTQNQGLLKCGNGTKPNSDKTACISESCPFGQVFNASKAKCVAATEDCDEGQYLPKNKLECSKCPDGWACKESNTYTFSSSKDQGKTEQCTGNKVANSKRSACETCPNDQEPNASHTQCVKKAQSESETTYCDPGYYLQKQSSSCKSCSSLGEKYYCPGGDLTVADNGLATCDDGYIANSDHTACVEKEKEYIYVPNGKYLKSTETTPSDCPDISTKYCPGGEYEKSATTQGIYDCPLNSRQNSTKDGCNITFTMEQLQYGYSNDSEHVACWIYENPDDYIDCVLGL